MYGFYDGTKFLNAFSLYNKIDYMTTPVIK